MVTKKVAKKTVKEQLIAATGSYLRASLAAVLALYISGITDPKILINAFLAGLAGPLLKELQSKTKKQGYN